MAIGKSALLLSAGAFLSVTLAMESPQVDQRQAEWATPINLPGVPNLFRLSPVLYRGAQPTPEGFRQLEQLGIKTVISLRSFHSDDEVISGTHLRHECIPFKAWHAEHEDAIHFLRLVTDSGRQPIFVHCQHGADRTGMMCAVYRVTIDHWTRDEAIREMVSGGFGYHPVWFNLVEYMHDLDADQLRRELASDPERVGEKITTP